MAKKKKKKKLRIDRVIIVLVIGVAFVFGAIKLIQFTADKVTAFFNSTDEEAEVVTKKDEPTEKTYIATIVIDPGHGGEDVGANRDTLLEKDINLKIAKVVGEELDAVNVKVVYTRTTDTSLSTIKKTDLKMRGAMGAANNADYFVSIHVNAYEGSDAISGFEVYSKDNNDEAINADSKELATAIGNQIETLKYSENRGIQSGKSLSVLRDNEVAGVLIETGYINNNNDYQYLKNDKKLTALGKAIAKGIYNQIQTKKGNK